MCIGGCTSVCIGGCTSVCVGGCTSVCVGGCTSVCVGECVSVCIGGCTYVCIDGCVFVYNIAILEVGVGTSGLLHVLKSHLVQLVPLSSAHTGDGHNMIVVSCPFLCCCVLSMLSK